MSRKCRPFGNFRAVTIEFNHDLYHFPVYFCAGVFIYLSLVDILTSVLNLVRKTIFFAENPCQIINLLRDFIFLVVLLSSMFFLNICFLRYWSIKEPLKPVSNTTVYAVIGLELTFFLISGVLLSYFKKRKI